MGAWYRIYSEADKPAADDVGALAVNGTAVNSMQLNGQSTSCYAPATELNSKANTADVLTETNTIPYICGAGFGRSKKFLNAPVVSLDYKRDAMFYDGKRHIGTIAEDNADINEAYIIPDADGEVEAVRYGLLTVPLLQAGAGPKPEG